MSCDQDSRQDSEETTPPLKERFCQESKREKMTRGNVQVRQTATGHAIIVIICHVAVVSWTSRRVVTSSWLHEFGAMAASRLHKLDAVMSDKQN